MKLKKHQYAYLVILNCLGSLFLLSIVQRNAGTESWLSVLLCVPFGIAINLLGILLFKSTNASLYDTNILAFGSFWGNFVNILYILYFFIAACTILNYYGIFTVNLILRDTPLLFFITAVLLAVAYTLRKDLLTVGRMATFFGIAMLIFSVLALFTEFGIADIRNLFPVNITNKNNFFLASCAFAYVQFGELFAVFSMTSETEKMKIFKVNLLSILLGNGLIILFALADALALGPTMSLQYAAFYRVIRIVDLGEFMNRIEVFVVSAYFLTTIFRVIINLHVVCKTLAHTAGLKEETSLTLPICALAIGVSVAISGTTFYTVEFITQIYPYICTVPFIIIPALAIIFIKKRKAL